MPTTNTDTPKGDFEAALEAGMQLGKIRTDLDVPLVVVPAGATIVNLEHFLALPIRKRGTVTLHDVASFVSYVNRHKETERTVMFASIASGAASFTCVFDHHAAEGSGWREHKAVYRPVQTPEWTRWSNSDRKQMSQKAFAEFIEESVPDIVNPSGAEMLEIVLRLEAKTSVQFTSGVRLQNGNQELSYVETTEAKAGEKGTVEVPATFDIGIKLFEGSPGYKISARLKYVIKEKQLFLSYELVRPHLVVRDAVNEIMTAIQDKTGITPLLGSE